VAPRISSSTNTLAREILSSFLRNPQTIDDLKGVAHSRLLEERVHQHVEDTDAALDWLVQHGFLRRIRREFTGPFYELNLQKRGKAEEFLATKKKRERARKKTRGD
jgi:hypothetical protein